MNTVKKTDIQKRTLGRTVLVVDDNPTIRKMLSTAFLSDGFQTCAEAQNGKVGIEIAKQVKPDVIILDLAMPVMNGLEAARTLHCGAPHPSDRNLAFLRWIAACNTL